MKHAALNDYREHSAYGTKKVWTAELVVGDWESGGRKTILHGQVFPTAVNVRP